MTQALAEPEIATAQATPRATCRICGSRDLQLLIDYGEMPLAGGFLRPEEMHRNRTFPLRLARCAACTLMQVLDTVPPECIFSRYSYNSSTTRTLIDHFARLGPELVRMADARGKLAVEFGCNDGVLMRPLLAAGARAIGVDPSDVAARTSREEGWRLVPDYFDERVAREIRASEGPARLIAASNVFAHTDDLHAIARGVTALLEDDSLFVFEVHYQGDLIAQAQFDTVYHEHICYYSLIALRRLLEAHELKILAVCRTPIHAGSIRVTACRAESKRAAAPDVDRMCAEEKRWDIERFVRQVETRRASLRTLIGDLRRAGRRVAAYGAAGRATILLNYCGFDARSVEYVVDMSPLRYGRMVPGRTREHPIPVVSPETFGKYPPDYALITAWNYEAEIVAKEQAFPRNGGRFIVPLPELRIVGEV